MGTHCSIVSALFSGEKMTKEGRHEYAQAVGIAVAHNATEPWRVLTAVTNDAARSDLWERQLGYARQTES